MSTASRTATIIIVVPFVHLEPILGPLGLLPEICVKIQKMVAYMAVADVMMAMYSASPSLSYSIKPVPWGPTSRATVINDRKMRRLCLNSRALQGPLWGIRRIIERVYKLERHAGPRVISDDWCSDSRGHDGRLAAYYDLRDVNLCGLVAHNDRVDMTDDPIWREGRRYTYRWNLF